jgi:hypothetical protein
MTIAKLAYLTSPAPGRYLLNIQTFGSDELLRFEIAQAHLANIVITGTSLALQVNNRVPSNSSPESADDSDNRRQQPA